MNVQEWLEQLAKIDEMINAKLAERDQVMTLSARLTPNMDGMPHVEGSVSDPVGNGAVKLAMLSQEIDKLVDQYVDYKKHVIEVLLKLPAKQFGVLHSHYVRYMTLEDIAEDMGYCVRQISRIKQQALKNLEDVLECHA